MRTYFSFFAHSQVKSKLESILKFDKLSNIFFNLLIEAIQMSETKEHLSPKSGHSNRITYGHNDQTTS